MNRQKKIYTHNNNTENGYITLKNMVSALDLKVTQQALAQVRFHPAYPSLLSLSEVLHEWGVETLAVKISTEQLTEIPFPAISHLHDSGNFIVINGFCDDKIEYVDSRNGLTKETIAKFQNKWSGVVLLVQATEKSGELDYKAKRRAELFNSVGKTLSLLLLGALILLPVFSLSLSLLSYYAIKILGCIFSIMLLLKQFGNTSPMVNSICRLGGKSDCDAVIHSPASKLFGVVRLSELGVLYFLGSIIFIGLSGLNGSSVEFLTLLPKLL